MVEFFWRAIGIPVPLAVITALIIIHFGWAPDQWWVWLVSWIVWLAIVNGVAEGDEFLYL